MLSTGGEESTLVNSHLLHSMFLKLGQEVTRGDWKHYHCTGEYDIQLLAGSNFVSTSYGLQSLQCFDTVGWVAECERMNEGQCHLACKNLSGDVLVWSLSGVRCK